MFYPQFKIDSKIQNAAAEVMKKITPRLQEIDEITEYNQQKMMAAFHEAGVSESHFVSSMDTVTEEETRWTWCMQRRWEQKMLWYAIIL